MKFRIVYIAGAGRSGSTILDIVLGANHKVLGMGELNNLFTSGWSNNEYCSCGQRANSCPFWGKVKTEWERDATITLSQYIHLQSKYIRFRSLPRLWLQKFSKSSQFKIFEYETIRLYRIIAETSDATVLVDSSKLPYRLLALKIMGFNPGVVHLVRDGRAVLNSLKKEFKADLKAGVQNDINPKSTIRTAIFWLLANNLTAHFRKNLRYILVKYEDFISDSIGELERIENAFSINLGDSKNLIANQKSIVKGHTIAGNRLRMQKEIKIKSHPDESWREKVSSSSVKRFELIAGSLLSKYGYK